MSAESNIKIIQNIYAAFGRGDVPAILEMLSEDVKWGIVSGSKASAGVPWHEQLRGRSNVSKFFIALATHADFTRFEPQAFVADDRYVYATISWDATYKKTGRRITTSGMHRFTFQNGRVSEWVGLEDTALSAEIVAEGR